MTEARIFRPLAPSPETGRSIVVYALGVLLGLVLLAVLWARTPQSGLHSALLGAAAALLWGLGRAWNDYRRQTCFARVASLVMAGDGLHYTDASGRETHLAWAQLKGEVSGGRLQLSWPDGELLIGSREWEDGMTLTRDIAARLAPHKPTNFIPLEPK